MNDMDDMDDMDDAHATPPTSPTSPASPGAAGTGGGPSPEVAALLAEMPMGSLNEKMGIELVEVGTERLVGTMPVEGNQQPYGLLHGGASVVLAESLGSVGSAMHARGLGKIAVGVDINATHHRAARSGVVTGVATPLHLGRSMASYEVVLTDERGKRVCTARITCALVDAAAVGG